VADPCRKHGVSGAAVHEERLIHAFGFAEMAA
jgi:hypothetical protein